MHILRIFSRPFESMYGPNERCHRPNPLISQPLRPGSSNKLMVSGHVTTNSDPYPLFIWAHAERR